MQNAPMRYRGVFVCGGFRGHADPVGADEPVRGSGVALDRCGLSDMPWNWDRVNIRYQYCCLHRFRPYGGSLFSRAKKVTKKALLPVWPSFVGFPHSGDAPWARAERASMPWRRLAGVPARHPTPRRLRSACTQVAICGVWTGVDEDQKRMKKPDRSHAPRGNAALDAPRPMTRSVMRSATTRSVEAIKARSACFLFCRAEISQSTQIATLGGRA